MFGLFLAAFTALAGLALWLGMGILQSLRLGGFDFLPGLYAGACAVGVAKCWPYLQRHYRRLKCAPPELNLQPRELSPEKPFRVAWRWPKSSPKGPRFPAWREGFEEPRAMVL